MIEINEKTLKQYTDLDSSFAFNCDYFGMSNTKNPNSISFLDSEEFLEQLNNNQNITTVITNNHLKLKIFDKHIIVCDEPRYSFYCYYNHIAEANYIRKPSIISTKSQINPTAYISDYNVVIGENSIIGPNVNILPDVDIGDNCIINAGVTIGSSGYEFKKTSKGILPVFHDGKVIIHDNVRIGANSTIDKGFSFRNTIIKKDVKIDVLVYIAHGVQIDEASFLVGHVMVSGSSTIGKNVWIGPGAIISSSIIIGDGAYISLGSVVTRDVLQFEKITGNFAIPHEKFIKNLKKII